MYHLHRTSKHKYSTRWTFKSSLNIKTQTQIGLKRQRSNRNSPSNSFAINKNEIIAVIFIIDVNNRLSHYRKEYTI
jgi:hypothetical protein